MCKCNTCWYFYSDDDINPSGIEKCHAHFGADKPCDEQENEKEEGT